MELPEKLSHIDPDEVVELDVRPIIEAGRKPFDPIMDAVSQVSRDGAFRLIVGFKPSPLIRVLRGEGWHHFLDRRADGAWDVWFFRP